MDQFTKTQLEHLQNYERNVVEANERVVVEFERDYDSNGNITANETESCVYLANSQKLGYDPNKLSHHAVFAYINENFDQLSIDDVKRYTENRSNRSRLFANKAIYYTAQFNIHDNPVYLESAMFALKTAQEDAIKPDVRILMFAPRTTLKLNLTNNT